MGLAPPFAPTTYMMPTHYNSTNNVPVGQPLQDGHMNVNPRFGEYRLGYHSAFLLLRLPNGQPTQNPEAEKKAEVSLDYVASGPSF